MVNIYIAYTEPVNPVGVLPTLTIPQLWAGLRRKVHRGQDFVKIITDTEVLEDSDTYIKRRVYFDKNVSFSPEQAIEVVTLYEPMKVCVTADQ